MKLEDLVKLDHKIEIADVGAACIGEAAPYNALLTLGMAHLHAFEADKRQHPTLIDSYGETMSLYLDILGDGEIHTLYLASPESGMTSLLKPSQRHLNFFNGFDNIGKIHQTNNIKTTKMDDVAVLPNPDYLKMDIQGAELLVLKNAMAKLKNCVAIHLEVSFVPLYENQPCFGDVDSWMRSQGYLPHAFLDVKRWSIAPTIKNNNFRIPFNQLLEADILYIKDPTLLKNLSTPAIKKLALIAHYCYQSPDLVVRLLKRLETLGDVDSDSYQHYLNSLSSTA